MGYLLNNIAAILPILALIIELNPRYYTLLDGEDSPTKRLLPRRLKTFL